MTPRQSPAQGGIVPQLCEIVAARQRVPYAAPAELVRVVPDILAVTLGGSLTGPALSLAGLSSTGDAAGSARLWGHGRAVSVRDAVLANTFAAHALDFDDDETETAMAHMSVTLVTAALTSCDAAIGPVSGQRLFAACAAGYDVAMAVGELTNPGMYRAGWHASATLGVFASAAACGALANLSPDRMAVAFALAASLASGVRGAFGGDGKPLQVAQAAASGLLAVQLAQRGFSAPEDALSGARGFLGVHGAVGRSFGTPVAFPPPGFVVKAYPTCTATHAAVAAVLDAATDVADGDSIQRIECAVDAFVPTILLQGTPSTPDQARFNMAYCLARAAIDRRLGPDAFRPGALTNSDVLDLMNRVEVTAAHDLPKGPSGISTGAHVVLHTRAGVTISRTRTTAPGSVTSPLSDDELLAKFSLCLEPFVTRVEAAMHFEALLRLPDADDVMTILGPLFDLVYIARGNGRMVTQ
ncbi:MmgE/PrpD family protein [Devosia sp.]|uniref:MmgE/PrpD family protein n=1 Tax=Devosia sp. TaxID=1871048 RepID=UPI0019F10480|nr:MmgE/PrpD family protein [Devosia sp.]MBE0578784.1 MmgE/PrpD family protein [Devosia sp.]